MNSQNTATVQSTSDTERQSRLALQSHLSGQSGRAWRIVRFLFHAAIGGAIGGHFLVLGLAIHENLIGSDSWGSDLLFIALPVYMIAGALLALVSAALTLILENLIEEQLTMMPRAIATSMFSILVLIALGSIDAEVDWELIKRLLLPGLALGFPVGIMITSRLRLSRLFMFGAFASMPIDQRFKENPILVTLSTVAGLALRLVGVFGFLVSAVALSVFWRDLEIDERMVITYSIYYFGGTTFVSLCLRSRLQVAAAGFFLNSLLLILAVYWEPSRGAANPLPLATFVLIFLWVLFISSVRALRNTRLALWVRSLNEICRS